MKGSVLHDSNMNYIYEEWFYTGNVDTKPQFTWEDDTLHLTYPIASGQSIDMKTVSIDCGYDTGHMEFNNNGDE